MSWDVKVVPETVIVYAVRCSTCGLNEEFQSQAAADERGRQHVKDHDDLWKNDDIGYDLNPERNT